MAGGVFVSYRRDDAAHIAGRIHDALVARLGRDHVFIDVDSVAPGEDFVAAIEDTIARADVMLAVIGPTWLAPTASGDRRIDRPDDFIRLELATALARGLRIIPVLADGATMPRADALPTGLVELARRNAVQIGHATFRRDMDALLDLCADTSPPPSRAAPRLILAEAGGLAALAVALSVWALGRTPPNDASAAGLETSVALSADARADPSAPRFLLDVAYRTERDADGRLRIEPDFPYRERMRRDGAISGLLFHDAVFSGSLPKLDVRVTNTSSAPIVITEILFDVVAAEPQREALPFMRESPADHHFIRVMNEGWGGFQSPRLQVRAWGLPDDDADWDNATWNGASFFDPCAAPSDVIAVPTPVVDGVLDADGDATFDLAGLMPKDYGPAPYVCALGDLVYDDGGEIRTLSFASRVSNNNPVQVLGPVGLGTYDLFLDPDREGYTAIVPTVLELGPGDTGAATVTVYTTMSTRFALRQSVRLASGATARGEAFDLEIVWPRRDHRSYWLVSP